MNPKLKTNALQIAELMGWKPWSNNKEFLVKGETFADKQLTIDELSEYNGLMPIIRECNNTYLDNVTHEIEISKYCVHIYIEYLDEPEEFIPVVDSYSYSYDTEPEHIDLIEALQMACITYLELKTKYKNKN